MTYDDAYKNIKIEASSIKIGDHVSFGKNISISISGDLKIGSYSQLGNDVNIRGNNVTIGQHLYHSFGLRVGGGGSQNPTANLTIGDRCTIHNNFINIAQPVEIGDDVGLSEDVTLMTHGYWLSVLEGFPAKFAGIKIGNGVIIGYRSLILPGVEIAPKIVVGAQSVVTRDLAWGSSVYAGSPAKRIRGILIPNREQKIDKLEEIIAGYTHIARYHGIKSYICISYPLIYFRCFVINVETFEYSGTEDEETDDFRDYMRRWGIRIYTERPFKSKSI